VLSGWRGLVGRANGGMVVHIGVVLVAIGLSAAAGFRHDGLVSLHRGQTATVAGHRVEFVRTRSLASPSHSELQAVLRVDGGGEFTPAISRFGTGTQPVGTPAIDSSWRQDVYLTIAAIPGTGTEWQFRVVVQPLVAWLWTGGALIVIGSILSAVPGRRRRPTDPVSAPVVEAPAVEASGAREADPGRLPAEDPLPVGAGDRP
jgi:cytochrome c-type biogenesis protein CcmF